MDFITTQIQSYCEKNSQPENEILAHINRKTHLEVLKPRMLSGHLQGNLLMSFSAMLRPYRVLEIGTYTGYSAICLAYGLAENGLVHTIDNNEELQNRILENIKLAQLDSQIRLHIGNALEIIEKLDEVFDLVFIDADKLNYANYYEAVLPKVRKGGFIIADNVLWSGKVVSDASDKETEAMRAFNQKITQDERVFNTLLPVRDGLMLVQKL